MYLRIHGCLLHVRCHAKVEYVSKDTWLSVACEMSC